MFALLFFRDVRIALDTPPAPMTKTFLFSSVIPSSFREFWKPTQSVLSPTILGIWDLGFGIWLNEIVFTAWICFASFDILSRCFITSTLCGIVTLIPSRSVVFMKCSRFSGATSNASYVCGRFSSLKTASCIGFDRECAIGCPITPNFFGSIG